MKYDFISSHFPLQFPSCPLSWSLVTSMSHPTFLLPFLDDLQSPVSDAHVSTDEGCPLKQWEIGHGHMINRD